MFKASSSLWKKYFITNYVTDYSSFNLKELAGRRLRPRWVCALRLSISHGWWQLPGDKIKLYAIHDVHTHCALYIVHQLRLLSFQRKYILKINTTICSSVIAVRCPVSWKLRKVEIGSVPWSTPFEIHHYIDHHARKC